MTASPSKWADFTTPEYTSYDKITAKKWEANRGIGHSFGYNRAEGPKDMLTVDELVSSLVDIVSKNGNLLLDVGPEADGTISALQLERLKGLGDWLAVNGEAIFDTHPWIRASGVTGDDAPVRFTQRENVVYVILLKRPSSSQVAIKDFRGAGNQIRLLGVNKDLQWHQAGNNLTVSLPHDLPGQHAWVLKITPAPRT